METYAHEQTVVSETVAPVDGDLSPGVCVSNEEEFADHSVLRRCLRKRACWILGVVVTVLAAGGVLAAVLVKHEKSNNGKGGAPKKMSAAYYRERFRVFRSIAGRLSSDTSAFVQSGTPQSQALDWMVFHDTTIDHAAPPDSAFTQRYAMLVLFYACGGEAWQGFANVGGIDKQGDTATCNWKDSDSSFVVCDVADEIVELILISRRLIGQLPNEIQLFTSLRTLALSENLLEGAFPDNMFGQLTQLGM